MKVLVCGGAGYIASHVVRQIQRETSWDIVILDNFSTGHWGTIPSAVPVEVGDIRDEAFLTRVFRKHRPDAVMHFCASIVVPDSVRDPLGYYDNNVVGSQRLLRAMVANGCLNFIFSSTAALFGKPDRVPIHPMDKTMPDSPYGDTKLIIEGLLKSCNVAYGMRFVCLRYFNACGADPSGEVGERHEPETHLVPVIIEQALGKRKQISVFGTDFPTRDGTCIRDYVHVNDLASAHILALKYLQNKVHPPGYFNLGSGVGSTVKEVIDAVEAVTGKKLNVVLAGRREGDPAELVADPTLANSALGWKPTFSLQQIVETAYRFHEKMHRVDLAVAPFEQSPRFRPLVVALRALDQLHLFHGWSVPGEAPSSAEIEQKKLNFFCQLEKINANYPGGIGAYVANARKLLANTRDGYNPWEGFSASVPAVRVDAVWSSKSFDEAEARALAGPLRKCGFVLVAGGLGERLGFNGIKIEIPVDCVSLQSHLAYYIEHIRAWNGDEGSPLRLAVMTSHDTHDLTLRLLHRLNLAEEVAVVMQEKVPALADNHGKLCLSSPFVLDTKPHGNGDVHGLLLRSGIAKKWLAAGVEHVVFIQDTNSLAMKSVPFAVAETARLGLDMATVCIPRSPGSAIGCIVDLAKGARRVTTNVEYNVLAPFLEATTGKGDVGEGPDGFSPFPGNTNTLVLNLATYVRVLDQTGGALPEYVAPKYVPGSNRHLFVSPARLECGMEDIAQLMPDATRVGVVVFPEWAFFNPVKNNIRDAAAKVKVGLPPWSAVHSEAQLYAYNASAMTTRIADSNIANNKAAPAKLLTIGPLEVKMPPRIVFAPSWLSCRADAQRKMNNVDIASSDATLLVKGRSVFFQNVTLDGVMLIHAAADAKVLVRDVHCRTPPWLIEEASTGGGGGAIVGVKGFQVVQRGIPVVLNFPAAGEFVYDGSRTPSKL
jgi:UDP-glucose 4-epimerase